MGKVYFLFGVHNHQPVGNFSHIFKEAYEKCYFPFLSTLKDFPKIKCAIHNSGPLYDWFLESGGEYLDILKKLVKEKRVEIISGGYYEPILPLISDEDKKGQIRLMNEFVKKQFKTSPGGLWLAERVWEPYLAGIINECGLKYTFLDDTHFRYAGCRQKEFFGYYTTEDGAKPVFVFPISKTLRYKIPFSQPREAIDVLKGFLSQGDVLVTLFDDGEKFGLWPHTYDWVYGKGWLKQFFSMLEDTAGVETITPSEAVEKFKSQGLVYLPAASYEEMGEWVLEPESFRVYERLKNILEKNNSGPDNLKDFVRGGFFRNFYRKYKRLNYMHKRMLFLSGKINNQDNFKPGKDTLISLWKAQTNCGYWHGIFGGFYLGHIRGAVYENLIAAENSLDKKNNNRAALSMEKADFDFDGAQEIFLKNEHMICCFSSQGGTLLEFSLRKPALNMINTITRKEESYHEKIRQNIAGQNKEVGSIHDIVAHKDEHLDKFLSYDKYERVCLADHLLDKNLTVDDFNGQKGVYSLSGREYGLSVVKSKKEIRLDYRCREEDVDFDKIIRFSEIRGFDVEYKFSAKSKKNIFHNHNFGVEFNLSLPSLSALVLKDGDKRIPLDEAREYKRRSSFEIFDSFKKITGEFIFDVADVFSLPLYSVSSSESGFEKVYQQMVILFIVKEKRNDFRISFRVDNL